MSQAYVLWSVCLVTTKISSNLDQILSYLSSVCTPWKSFQYFTRRKSWIFLQFSPTSPPKFPSFSHLAILRAYVSTSKSQLTSPSHSTVHKSWHWQLKNWKNIDAKYWWEDAWIDGVIYRPSLSHSVKECDQHPPTPSRPLPSSKAMQAGKINAYQVRELKQGMS